MPAALMARWRMSCVKRFERSALGGSRVVISSGTVKSPNMRYRNRYPTYNPMNNYP